MQLLNLNLFASAHTPKPLWRSLFRALQLCMALIALMTFLFIGALLWAGPESYFVPYPAIDTKFTAGYSEAGFRAIRPGMTKAEVLQLLGEPYNSATDQSWVYSQDGAFPFWDFAWLARGVNFDAEGRVIERSEMIAYD